MMLFFIYSPFASVDFRYDMFQDRYEYVVLTYIRATSRWMDPQLQRRYSCLMKTKSEVALHVIYVAVAVMRCHRRFIDQQQPATASSIT